LVSYRIISRNVAAFNQSQVLDTIAKPGKAQIEVVGQLNSGRYFFGTDSVWIINPPAAKPIFGNWGWRTVK